VHASGYWIKDALTQGGYTNFTHTGDAIGNFQTN